MAAEEPKAEPKPDRKPNFFERKRFVDYEQTQDQKSDKEEKEDQAPKAEPSAEPAKDDEVNLNKNEKVEVDDIKVDF